MPLPPDKYRARIDKAKQNASIKDVIESTGAQPVRGNAEKGEYSYHAPYRDDSTPSLTINVHDQTFCDFGMTGARGDVIELARLILGKGDKASIPFFEAVKWVERQAGGMTVTPQAIKPVQREKKPSRDPSEVGRFLFSSAKPITAKTHPNNLDYIRETRKIGLPLASRHLSMIAYKDTEAAFDDPWRGMRYGIGWVNDAGAYEVRAASQNSKFKMVLGPKDITTMQGRPDATTGDVFESQFDFLTMLEMTGRTQPDNPTIILNSGAMASRAAAAVKTRPELSQVTNWRIWQQNDDEGDRSTQAFIMALDSDHHTIGTLNHLWEGFKDLNEFWTTASDQQRAALKTQIIGNVPTMQKSYDTSASAEARRTLDARRGPTNNPSFS